MSVRGNKLFLSILLMFLFCARAHAGLLCQPDEYFLTYGGGFHDKGGVGTFSRLNVYDAEGNHVGYTYGGFDVAQYFATMPRDVLTAYMIDRICYVQKAETLEVIASFSYSDKTCAFSDHAFMVLDRASGEIRVYNDNGEVIFSHTPQMYKDRPVGEYVRLSFLEGDSFYYLRVKEYESEDRYVCILSKDGTSKDTEDPDFPEELLREAISAMGEYLLVYDAGPDSGLYDVVTTDGVVAMRSAISRPRPWGFRSPSGYDDYSRRKPKYLFLQEGEKKYRVFDTALCEVGEIIAEKVPDLLQGDYLAGMPEDTLEGRICEGVMTWNGLYSAPYAREEDGIVAYLPGTGLRHFPLEEEAIPKEANDRYILVEKNLHNILCDAESGEEIWDIGDEARLSETTLMTGRSTLMSYDLMGERTVYDMDLNEVFSTPKPLLAIGADCYFYANMHLMGVLNEHGDWILRESFSAE